MIFKLKHYSFVLLFMLGLQAAWAQCFPTGTAPVFGTVTAASGTVTFTNVPTGNVIQVNAPAANTQYLIDLCGTNPGASVPAGTNDGYLTVLDANSPTANDLDFFDDGCANVAAPGYGPPVGTWIAPAAGTYFLYLTEYNAAGTDACIADGVNSAYDFSITITAPPSNDLAIDSAYMPTLYTSIAIQQLTPFSVGARVKNQGGSTASNIGVSVRVRNLTTATVVNTQTLTGPASLTAGATANVTGTAYTAPSVTGVYEFRYICSMTQTDGNKINDTAFRYVIVDTSLLALDEAILFGNIDNVLGIGAPSIIGQKYSFNVGTSIDTVFGYFFWDAGDIGDSIQAVIYNTAGGVPSTLVASSPIRITTAADTGGRLIPFVFAPNFVVTPGTYFVGMKQIGTDNMALAYTEGNAIGGNGFFSVTPFTTWNSSAGGGFPGSFLIWVNTKCTLAATANGTAPTCGQNNGSVALNVTGNNGTPTYNWSNSTTGASLTNVGPGTYTVTVNDGGCVTVTQATLTNSGTAVTVTATPTNAACGSSDGSVTATANGGNGNFTYAWSNNGGNVSGISNLSSGNYTVTVTSNGCTASATAFVGNTGGPSASASSTAVSCNGGANGGATATATGGTAGYTYVWSNSGNTAAISGLTAGTYTVTISDANSCQATASVTVSQPAAIVPTVTVTPVSCFNGTNGSATVAATGGTGNLGYAWTGGSTTTTVNNLAAGNYCVTVTDANNCSVSACQTISNPAQITATASGIDITCNGLTNGGASVTATGGTGSLTYTWSNNGTTTSIANLAAGTYTVTVKDANNCSVTATTSLTEPTALTASATCVETILGQSTGSATVTAAGGTPGAGYSYNWSSGSTSATATSLPAGVVNVTVTDANNCTVSTNCEVQFISGIEDVAGVSAISVYPNPSNGMFTVNVMLNTSSVVEMNLMDVRGAVVLTEKFNSTTSITKAFDVTTLAKGVYNLKITTASGVVSRKVVVN